MITIYPQLKLIKAVGTVYSVLVAIPVALTWMLAEETTLWRSISVAASVATIFGITLSIVSIRSWRVIWAKFPSLNKSMFPDINGVWSMRIHYTILDEKSHQTRYDSVEAIAHIKQSLFELTIEVNSDKSDSETLSVQPIKEPVSQDVKLYYVFRVTPRRIDGVQEAPYIGSAILLLRQSSQGEFGGNYFTDRYTSGYYSLKRI